MRSLEWRDVDLPDKFIRLWPDVSKNKEARPLPLTDDFLDLIEGRKTTGAWIARLFFIIEASVWATFVKHGGTP
jgi:hypothetical protein